MKTCPHGDPACPCGTVGTPSACHIDAAAHGRLCALEPMDAHVDDALAHCHVEGCTWRAVTPTDALGTCGLLALGAVPVLDGGFASMSQARPGSPLWSCGWLRTPLNVGPRAAS